MGSVNYRMYVLCENCFHWQSFDIPKGVIAKKVIDKRNCKRCGCIFPVDVIPVNTQQANQMKRQQQELIKQMGRMGFSEETE